MFGRALAIARLAGWVAAALAGSIPAMAADRPLSATVLRVVDGDTVAVRMLDGPCGRGPCRGQELRVRLDGIDTAETRACGTRRSQSCAACAAEVDAGRRAKSTLARWLPAGMTVRLTAIRPDPYPGRIVARMEALIGGQVQDVSGRLLAAGLAVRYEPKGRDYTKSKPWCGGS